MMIQKRDQLAMQLKQAKSRCHNLQDVAETKQAKILEFMKRYISIRKLV